MSTLRKQLHDRLKPLLPADYVLRPNAAKLENITTKVVQLKQLGIEPAREAPLGQLRVDFVVTLANPRKTPQRAEDELDDDVVVLLAALDRLGEVAWTRADKVVTGPGDAFLAYDITLTCTTKYDTDPEVTP